MGFPFRQAFHFGAMIAGSLGGELGRAVAAAEEDINATGVDKKKKAVAVALDSLHGWNSIVGGLDPKTHPELVDKAGKINDAIVEFANAAAAISAQAHIPPGPLPQADGSGN